MMSVSACGATMAGSYFTTDKENYYTRDATAADKWQGSLCQKIGLEDGAAVRADDFQTVLAARQSKCVAYDVTFSAPKSISILSQIGSDQARADMLEAHREAVREVLQEIEKNEIFTRTKKNGVITEHQTGNMAAACFEHNLSRDLDPQVHSHCVILNNTEYNGKLYAINGKRLFKTQKIYGAEYRARLASKLRARGYEITVTDKEKGFFELAGMENKEDLEIFSQRRAEIVRELEARGESGAEAAQAANLRTRGAKQHANTEELREQWREAWGDRPLVEANEKNMSIMDMSAEQKKAYQEAVATLEARQYAWTEKQFEEEILARGVSCEMTRERARELIRQDREILRGELNKQEPGRDPEQYFSTRHNIETEEKLFQSLADGRGNFRAALDHDTTADTLAAACKENGWNLQPQQEKLVFHVAESQDQIIAVRGLAGTGKSFSLNAAREVLERQGYDVIGAAPSGQAAHELAADANLKQCGTVQHILNQAEKAAGNAQPGQDYENKTDWNFENIKAPERPLVYIVDEAGMMNNDTTRELFKLAEAQRAAGGNVKICLVGDDRQLPPVGAGNFFSDAIQRGAVSVSELTDIQRQKDPQTLKAVQEAVNGSPTQSLEILANKDAIHEVKTAKGRTSAITKEYMKLSEVEREKTLILTAKNQDRKMINTAIRAERIKRGEIDEGKQYIIEGKTGKPETRNFSQGDKIICLQNDERAGVMNGTTGKIEKIEGERLTIKTGEGQRVTLDTSKYKKLDHAYAVTTHKAQGATVDRVIINMSSNDKSLNSRNSYYVNVSRARQQVSLYCDSRQKCGEQVQQFARKYTSKDFTFNEKTGNFSRVRPTPAPTKAAAAGRSAANSMKALVPPIQISKPILDTAAKIAGIAAEIAKAPIKIAEKVVEKAAEMSAGRGREREMDRGLDLGR